MAFPDVCNTPAPPAPPIPIPYPSTGMFNQATGTCEKVKICNKEVVTTKSKIPRSIGDEAGTAGGLVSRRNMDEIQPKKGSSKVKAGGHSIVSLTSIMAHNGTNANAPAGTMVAPSQTKVHIGL